MPKVGTTAATLRIAPFPRELGTAVRRDAIPEALFAIGLYELARVSSYEKTGRTVVVRVNDRGPCVKLVTRRG
jgi:hypothetical protein